MRPIPGVSGTRTARHARSSVSCAGSESGLRDGRGDPMTHAWKRDVEFIVLKSVSPPWSR